MKCKRCNQTEIFPKIHQPIKYCDPCRKIVIHEANVFYGKIHQALKKREQEEEKRQLHPVGQWRSIYAKYLI